MRECRPPKSALPFSHFNHPRQFLQKIRQRLPQGRIVFLQCRYFLGVHAVGVGMDRYLVEVIGAPPLQGHQLPDGSQINVQYIAIEGHFPHIGSHVPNTGLRHALLYQRLFLLGHHNVQVDGTAALLCHRSSRSRDLALGGISRTLSTGFSVCSLAAFICSAMGRFTSCTP